MDNAATHLLRVEEAVGVPADGTSRPVIIKVIVGFLTIELPPWETIVKNDKNNEEADSLSPLELT